MQYNDEKLAGPEQMNEMAKAYASHITQQNKKEEFTCYSSCAHTFNEAGGIITKLKTKATNKKVLKILNAVYEDLLNDAKKFYNYFNSSPKEEELTLSKSYFPLLKQLITCLLSLTNQLLPLKEEKEIYSILTSLNSNLLLLVSII